MKDEISFPKMKAAIQKTGGLFYQYRPCKREATTIYDIENIRHDVVYARTPLQMNDPYDSSVGFSTEKICDEVIDLVLDSAEVSATDNVKLLLKYLIKYRMLGKIADFILALNKLKRYITKKCVINHISSDNAAQYFATNYKKLFKDSPSEIKKVFNAEAFLVFSLVISDYKEVDIDEKTLLDTLKLEDMIKELEATIEKVKNDIYLPFLRDYLSKVTITCFSASGWNNQLMWSHYANSYNGICVEYDFNKMNEFIGFVYKVNYSSERPTIMLKDLGFTSLKKDESENIQQDEVNISSILSYMLTKNKCWDYEEEWRIINQEDDDKGFRFVKTPFVKSITIGLNVENICKNLIWDVCKEKNIECYQLVVNPSDYVITRELLNDESFKFDEQQELEYINLLCEHAVSLNEKMSTSANLVSKSLQEELANPTALINTLTHTLDYLSDVYFLKTSFNRYCKNVDNSIEELENGEEIINSIHAIDKLIASINTATHSLDGSLFNMVGKKMISWNDAFVVAKFIKNTYTMLEKHNELKWYGVKTDDIPNVSEEV